MSISTREYALSKHVEMMACATCGRGVSLLADFDGFCSPKCRRKYNPNPLVLKNPFRFATTLLYGGLALNLLTNGLKGLGIERKYPRIKL